MNGAVFLSESSVERAARRLRVMQERAAQGFTPTLTDPAALARTARTVRDVQLRRNATRPPESKSEGRSTTTPR